MRHLPSLLVLALLAVGLSAGPAAGVGDVSDTIAVRLPGGANTPAAVALRLSRATFPDGGADEVLLATQTTFADALASGTLQGEDRPLLLTTPDALRADVAGEIDRLGASRVTLLGGVAAIQETVADALEDVGLRVGRIAGETRYETAIAVASRTDTATTALLARGFGAGGDDTQAFADALAAGAWAAEEGWPTLLTDSAALTPVTRRAIADLGVREVVVLGGEAAIAPAVVEEIRDLGVAVRRVAGATRFDTAAAIAAARGLDDLADADRVILAEGQADDAWAAGFAAAAHAARVPAPILLANGDALPEPTAALLQRPDGAAAPSGESPVLVCAAAAAACAEARRLIGLPAEAVLTLDDPAEGVPSRSVLTGTVDLHGESAELAIFGGCVTDGLVVPDPDGRFGVEVAGRPGACQLRVEVRFPGGTVQRIDRSILVRAADPVDGVVVDTETGVRRYTIADYEGERLRTVDYGPDDLFVVDGDPATIGVFESRITVADEVTVTADTADGTRHELREIDPESIARGMVGHVDLAAGTIAIIEPLSGVALRRGVPLAGAATYRVDSALVDRAAFEAELNEGDRLAIVAGSLLLTNAEVGGAAADIDVDAISGVARFRIGPLGDDPRNAEDDRFRAVASLDDQRFAVDGEDADFAAFAAALTPGDEVTYGRTGGVESFALRNRPLPPVEGIATETADPDGDPTLPQPRDGGSVVVLTAEEGRQLVTYTPGATFRVDERLATEEEFEAALSPGDRIRHQPGDAATGTAEVLELRNLDLTGSVADITPGERTLDVVVLAGVVYDDLDYAAGVLGGASSYVVDDRQVGITRFEGELLRISRGERQATITVRAVPDGTEHRLATRPG